MTIEAALEIFFALKAARDNFKHNKKASHFLVSRLSSLEGPLLKIQSQELSVAKDVLETLEEALQTVRQFLDKYNETTMWRSFMRAINSGKYAEDFVHVNQLIDRALQTVGLSLNITNEERRQQDLDEMKSTIASLSKHVITDMQSHIAPSNEEEKKRYEDVLSEVKLLSLHEHRHQMKHRG